MLDANAVPSSLAAARLRVTLANGRTGLTEEAASEARRLYREQATELVVALVEGALARRGDDPAAVRAAHLAGELRLTGAAPALGRCLERLSDEHPLRQAALVVLPRLEAPGADALLAAFERCDGVADRVELAAAFARVLEPAGRIRAALVKLARELPDSGAAFLAARGEWRAVPELLAILDHLSASPPDHCDICTHLDLVGLAAAVRCLGGELTDEQEVRLLELAARAETALLRSSEHPAWRAPPAGASRVPRPGRNEPCPCGSGQKYKRCCLERDLPGERD